MSAPAERVPTTHSDPDERLQRSRRIDWRFVLPDPSPGRVGYLGPPDPELLDALVDAGWETTVLDEATPWEPGLAPGLDLVVVVRPIARSLAHATRAVRDGGALYVECRGVIGRSLRDRSLLPSVAARRLERAGFGGIRRHCPVPGSNPRMIVPIDAPQALGLLMARRRGLFGRWPVRAGIEVLRRTGLLQLLAPTVALVAARSPNAAPDAVSSHLDRTGARLPDAATSGPLLLTPRFRASRNVVALVPNRPGREAVVAVKLSRQGQGGETTKREADVLRTLEQAGGARTAPRVLDVGAPWGLPTLVETAVPGTPLDPGAVRRDPETAAELGLGWLVTLARPGGDPRPAAERLDRLLFRPLDVFESAVPLTDDEARIVEDTRGIGDTLRDARLPSVTEHGDASHPNLIRTPDGGLTAVDWELGVADGIAGHDLFSFLAYLAIARAHAATPAEQGAAIVDAVVRPADWAGRALLEYAGRIGLDPALLRPLGVVAWCRLTIGLVERLHDGTLTATAPETVAWLRDHRFWTAWRTSAADLRS